MAHVKVVVIELKSFEVSREGQWLILTERGREFVKSMRMELATARWFSKALEDGRTTRRKGFHASHREGDRGFTVQRCTNIQGAFMAMEERRGGGRQNCILVPDDRDERGWWKLAELLREVARIGVQALLVTIALPKPPQLYKEAFHQPRSLNLNHQLDRRATSGAVSGVVYAGYQEHEEDGRRGVGLKKEMALRVLTDMQKQMGELQDNINYLKQCVEDQRLGQMGAGFTKRPWAAC